LMKSLQGKCYRREYFSTSADLPVDINSSENVRLSVQSEVVFVPFSKCTTKKKGYEKILISMLMIYRLDLKQNDLVLFNEIRIWRCLFPKVVYTIFWYELRTQVTKYFNKEVLLCATDYIARLSFLLDL